MIHAPSHQPSRALRAHVPSALAVAALAACLASAPASAGVPDPRFCEADTCMVLSPGGLFSYEVILRDESYAPVANATVTLDFGPAPGIVLCDSMDPDGDGRVTALTDAQGRVEFFVRGGGQTAGHAVVGALGQTVRVAYPRSTDLDGSLTVNQQDVDLHAALPAASRAGDYDCDGDSDASDRQQVTLQMGQDCGTVDVLSCTWGRVKAAYR